MDEVQRELKKANKRRTKWVKQGRHFKLTNRDCLYENKRQELYIIWGRSLNSYYPSYYVVMDDSNDYRNCPICDLILLKVHSGYDNQWHFEIHINSYQIPEIYYLILDDLIFIS